jgi:hypothetical protein
LACVAAVFIPETLEYTQKSGECFKSGGTHRQRYFQYLFRTNALTTPIHPAPYQGFDWLAAKLEKISHRMQTGQFTEGAPFVDGSAQIIEIGPVPIDCAPRRSIRS